MNSIRYNVVNKHQFGESIFAEYIQCRPTLVVEVVISPHVLLPFWHSSDSHNSSGSIAD